MGIQVLEICKDFLIFSPLQLAWVASDIADFMTFYAASEFSLELTSEFSLIYWTGEFGLFV